MKKIFAVSGSASGIGQAVVAALKSLGDGVITIDVRDADICADPSPLRVDNSAYRH